MIFDVLVVAIFYYAALAWGSSEPWAMAILAVASLLTLAARLIWDAARGELRFYPNWIFAPLILFLAYTSFQAFSVRSSLAADPAALPHTVEPYSTKLYLLLALGYFSLALLVSHGFRTREQVRRLILAILVLGAFEALYGLAQHPGGYGYVWDFAVSAEFARGTLINRNHYALLMNLTLSCGLGYLYYRSWRMLRGQNITLRHILSAPGSANLAWVILWLALVGLALIMSMSRMGIVAMFGCVGFMMTVGKASEKGRRVTAIGLSLLLAILGLALYAGVDAVVERYEKISEPGYLEKGRVPIWRDAWKMIERRPVYGQGLGSFQWTFPAFETENPDIRARYAHNDFLQALAEVGVVGLLLIAWAFVACWRTATRNLTRSDDPLVRGIGLATLGALTAALLQELTDFSFYIPGVAASFAVIVGLNLRASQMTHEQDRSLLS